MLTNAIKFGFMELMFYLSKFSLWANAEYIYPQSLQCDTPPVPPVKSPDNSNKAPKNIIKKQELEERKKYKPCDKKATLYMMQQEHKHEETVQTEIQ